MSKSTVYTLDRDIFVYGLFDPVTDEKLPSVLAEAVEAKRKRSLNAYTPKSNKYGMSLRWADKIRKEYTEGDKNLSKLSRIHGVPHAMARKIVSGKIWYK